jgi:hypothetical protein
MGVDGGGQNLSTAAKSCDESSNNLLAPGEKKVLFPSYYVAKSYILKQDSNAIDLIGYPQYAACNAIHSQIMPRHKTITQSYTT